MSKLKSRFANLTPSKMLKSLVCILSSLWIAIYVNDVYTLRFLGLRLLVFVGILTVHGILMYIAGRLFKSAPSFKAILPSVAIAVLLLFVCRDVFFPLQQEVYISLIAETTGEICLCDVVVDGINIPVMQAEVVENSGWLYRETYDNFMIWPEEEGVENRLTMRFIAEEVHIGFPYTPYAGSVTIESSVGNSSTWDLRCPEWAEGEEVKYADFPIDCRRVYTLSEFLLYVPELLLFLSFLCLNSLYAVGCIFKFKKFISLYIVGRIFKFKEFISFYAVDCIFKFKEVLIGFLSPKLFLIYLNIIVLFFLSWIQLELSSTYDKWIDVFTMSTKYIMINIITICTVYLFIYLITDSLWKSCMIFSIFITLISVVNYYVIEFHGTPLTFMELKNWKTALNVIGSYKFDIEDISDLIYIFCAEFILCYIIKKIVLKFRRKRRPWGRLIKDFCLCFIILGIIFSTYLSSAPFMDQKVVGAWTKSYNQYGYAACIARLAVNSAHFLQKPDGYENGIDNIKFVKGEHDSQENERPDIILILNETFYDLSLITDIKTDVPYLENIPTLENTIKGYAVVPYIGGSTNCSEYELLTSNSLRLMPGVTPFQIINMEGANTVVSHLKQLGYYTIGGHPEKGSNYNRINAYADMGLDKYYFYDDFVDRKSYGNKWVLTDESAYENLLLWMRGQTATPQFIYLLTIQNHGAWDQNERQFDTVHVSNDYGEYNEVIDEYLTGIKMSDSAFKYLTDQLKGYDRKVIVCMVGDHSPSFANEIIDQKHSFNSSLLLRSTPFIIWANFDIEDKDMGTISMNYMIPTLLETAKVPLSQYYQYMLDLREDVPILTSHNTYYDKNMEEYLYDADSVYSEKVNNYFYMEYNNLQKDRKQQFFDAFLEEQMGD